MPAGKAFERLGMYGHISAGLGDRFPRSFNWRTTSRRRRSTPHGRSWSAASTGPRAWGLWWGRRARASRFCANCWPPISPTAFRPCCSRPGSSARARAVLQAILHGLRQPYRGMDAGELRLALADYLTASPKCPAGMLLVIDEAHLLSARLLDELRLVTNLVVRGQPKARLVLAGDAALEERLADPMLTSFSQRIVARCYLEPLNRVETEEYISRQIERVGGRAGRAAACFAAMQPRRSTRPATASPGS